jgi:hypothetical protein
MSKSVDTRRLYKLEHTFFMDKPYLRKPRAIKFLRDLAAQVWAKHGRSGSGVPSVAIVDGAPNSHCCGRSEIVLATDKSTYKNVAHNTVDTLLHELTHAMGYTQHGKAFVRKYMQLLVEYGKCDEGELSVAMSMFKVKH